MEAVIEQIIAELLTSDTERIRLATAELKKVYVHPEGLQGLCQIIASDRPAHVRQFAAMLLNKRLRKLRHWKLVPAELKERIKTGILQVLFAEKEKSVMKAIAQLIGSLLRHEDEKNDLLMTELLHFIYSRCRMDDPKESVLGSSIFVVMADTAPDKFVNHMDSICEMFGIILTTTEAKGNLNTSTVANMIKGVSMLTPFMCGHAIVEASVAKTLPLIINAVFTFVQKDDDNDFRMVFEIFESISEYVPRLLNNSMKHLIGCCLQTAGNDQINDSIRVQVIVFIGRVLRKKKKDIIKQKLLEPIITCIFEVICSETDVDDDILFSSECYNTPATAATQTLDILAINMSPDKLIPPLLQLLEPAFQHPDPMRRRAAFVCIAIITEGCSDAICSKYLEVMLNVVKGGIDDVSPIVQAASFFTLGQFAEHLQPDISKFAPQILPILLNFLEKLVMDLKSGKPESNHTSRMLYAVEMFCQNLENVIGPHLPMLMSRLFDVFESSNSVQLRVATLCAISASTLAAKEDVMPYFAKLVEILQKYLVKDCSDEIKELRIEAINVLAVIARVVGTENFMPLANDTMAYCLMILNEVPSDPDLKYAIYNLLGALSSVMNERMSTVFPKIFDRIIESVTFTEDIHPSEENVDSGENVLSDVETDLTNTDNESDDIDYQIRNDFLCEKEIAILTLKEFAVSSGSAFAPYLQIAFENVYKVIDHPHEDIRNSCIETICAFITTLHQMGNSEDVKRGCTIVMTKFAHMIRNDNEQGVVIHLLDMLSDLFLTLKHDALPTPKISKLIFTCIKDVLNKKVSCQLNDVEASDEDDDDESEFDEMLIESAGNLLPAFGKALTPQIFSSYFSFVIQYFLNKLNKAKKNDWPEQRSFVYGVLADCFNSLENYASTYFDMICPVFIDGINDSEPKARQNCYFGLGELVLYSGEKSFNSFQQILQALSVAIASEKNAPALDNICGAVCRMIVANYNIVPLAQVLPVLLSHLPLREDMDENEVVHKAFLVIFMHAHPIIVDHIEQILKITTEALYNNQISDGEGKRSALTLVSEIRQNYPDKFNNVANSNEKVYDFLRTL